jgi:hypothetical protein
MHDSQHYRDNAAASLLAAQEACQLHLRKLHLSMAVSSLSLAREDEASSQGTGYRPALIQEDRAA